MIKIQIDVNGGESFEMFRSSGETCTLRSVRRNGESVEEIGAITVSDKGWQMLFGVLDTGWVGDLIDVDEGSPLPEGVDNSTGHGDRITG